MTMRRVRESLEKNQVYLLPFISTLPSNIFASHRVERIIVINLQKQPK